MLSAITAEVKIIKTKNNNLLMDVLISNLSTSFNDMWCRHSKSSFKKPCFVDTNSTNNLNLRYVRVVTK